MTDFVNEQSPLQHSRARRFTPAGTSGSKGIQSVPGTYSTLTDECTGDWSWKPYGHPGARCRQPIGRAKQTPMTTFRGVPPSAAELYGRAAYRKQA